MPDARPSLPHLLLRLGNRIRARGAAEVLGLLRVRLRGAWSSEETLILLVREVSPLEKKVPGVHFRRAEPRDAARYARDVGTDSAATFTARLRDDVMCFIAEEGDRILHASWVTTSGAWAREVQALLSPPTGDAYVYESFTRSDARGRGIYPFALAGMLTELSPLGVRRLWVGVEASNQASRRAIGKAGFEEAFSIRFSRRRGKLSVGEPIGPLAAEGRSFLGGG